MAKIRQEWVEPAVDWLPLGKATFKFGIADDRRPAVRESRDKLTDGEIVNAGSFSKAQLTEFLEKQSGAHLAKIDRDAATFYFHFSPVRGGGSVIGGAPWAILRDLKSTGVIDPRIEAQAAFATAGIVRIADADAEDSAKRSDAVRSATGLVWRQLMLRAFNRAISIRSIFLYARPGNILANYEQLPAESWPLLDVADWQNGVAVAPDHTIYWNIHVGLSAPGQVTPENSATSAQPGRERAKIALADLYPDRIPEPAIEPNVTICRKVAKWLHERKMPAVSDATILRAANRRK